MDVLVVSSYPEKSVIHSGKTVGVANYTKATLIALVKANPKLNIRVFADVLDKKETYVENKIKVERTWRRNNVPSIYKMLFRVFRDDTKVLLMPFEMFIFGSIFILAFVLPLLVIPRLLGKKVVLVMHQVLKGDISTFEKNPLKSTFYALVRKLFYGILVFSSTETIVFEEEFKQRLGRSKKVKVVPHAVLQEHVLDKKVAREKLGLDLDQKYVFYFGFLAPYKGIIELLNIWDHINGVSFIIGGGPNPNHLKRPEYKDYVDQVLKKAREKNALATGFIPEEQMQLYFSAADIVIFPYTVFMASSGPLSHAFSYGKGVLLSNTLRGYFNSEDMRDALEQSGVSIDEICFDLEKPVRSKVLWALHNQEKLQDFSNTMCRVRSWQKIGQDYNKVLQEVAK